ncbi:uncharacterized protein PV09_02319 [Verruconis gallopava]|uniref:Uncharacterized protein n=1 Tax=Verruconis gallopava TaxID=253628 RepID=A0A0D2B5U8_9PEZI|nr:uncharacterized protein PV09_02319 [Verruconis gallopava]KIW06604.1 hypothetical protein PV09_02319 [Verruconis gallopava]
MVEAESEVVIDWGYLDPLIQDYLPNGTSIERMDFEKIASTEAQIDHMKERLMCAHLKASKKSKIEYQLGELEAKLAKLKDGHEKVARVLRQKAISLKAMPIELREAIFEHIYVQSEPIEVFWSRIGNKIVYKMPMDTALYMSSFHVGPDLAHEAARVFYKKNTFAFVRVRTGHPCHYGGGFSYWNQDHIDGWFQHDHYGSGVAPKEFVRSVELRLDRPARCFESCIIYGWTVPEYIRLCNHFDFETISGSITLSSQNDRVRIRCLLRYKTIRRICFTLPWPELWLDTLVRTINPCIHELKAAGVEVSLVKPGSSHGVPDRDLTSIFDTPTKSDCALYYQFTKRSSVFEDDKKRDLFETWKAIEAGRHAVDERGGEILEAYSIEAEKLGVIRVWLSEHCAVHEFLKREGDAYKAVDDMIREFKNLSPEARDLRRRFFPAIMNHIQ